MDWNIDQHKQDLDHDIAAVKDMKAWEACRVKYLGRKGLLPQLYARLAQTDPKDKPARGKEANALRQYIQARLTETEIALKKEQRRQQEKSIDITLPGIRPRIGHAHVVTQTIDEICGLFADLGFVREDGPEMETEFHNFEALNIPVDHPSRDAFDTFYLHQKDPEDSERHLLLRSQTSPGQIRVMRKYEPPLAVVIPGRVYRPDAVDASHSFMFHQIEGLLVDEHVTFAELKGLLSAFCRRFFGENVQMRFRPHFFPFTEPSAEVDISAEVIGKQGWLEIMGCGLVHPKVFEAAGYPEGRYTGLAFGLGVDRIAMLKHGIQDIRILYENDQRFLHQF